MQARSWEDGSPGSFSSAIFFSLNNYFLSNSRVPSTLLEQRVYLRVGGERETVHKWSSSITVGASGSDTSCGERRSNGGGGSGGEKEVAVNERSGQSCITGRCLLN